MNNVPHDYASFPGKENPLINIDAMTGTVYAGGVTGVETLGYPANHYDDPIIRIETLDQHDVLDHPGVDTPSGVDHVNPRGMISTDGKLDVPEKTVGSVNLEEAIAKILARNTSRITVRAETPGTALIRTITVDAINPLRIATQDDMRASIKLWLTSGSIIVAATLGEALSQQGGILSVGNGILTLNYHDDVFIVATTSSVSAIFSYVSERWEQN